MSRLGGVLAGALLPLLDEASEQQALAKAVNTSELGVIESSSSHLALSPLTSWESHGCQVNVQLLFEKQLRETKRKAIHMDKYIKQLLKTLAEEEEVVGKGPVEFCPELAKAGVLSAQLKVYRTLVEIIVAQDGKLKLDEPTDEAMQKEFWQHAWILLKLMGDTFDESLNLSKESYIDLWRDFTQQINFPCGTAGVAIGVATSTCISVTVFPSMLHHLMASPLVSTGVGTAGIVVGILVAAAIIGAIAALRCAHADDISLPAQQQRLQRMTAKLREEELTPAVLLEFREGFRKVFHYPVRQQVLWMS